MELVGRERELATLRSALDDALAGSGRLVLVAGDPGIGKTSLVDALATEASRTDAAVLWGSGWDEGGSPAYWPWVQVLRAAAREGAADAVDAAASLLGPLGPAGTGRVDDRFALYDAVAGVLTTLAERRPVVAVVDDLHASGAASALLLEFLTRHLHRARVLLVGTYRPAEVAAQADVSAVLARLEGVGTVVHPAPLDADGVAGMVARLGASAGPDLLEAILDRTQGNPLFVGHVVRALSAGGDVRAAAIPDGLGQALRRQAGRVTEGTPWPEALAVAATLGQDLSRTRLARLLDAEAAALGPLLDRAAIAGLLEPAEGDRLRFTHALARSALTDGLTPANRAALHLRIARVLESEAAPPARLAHHFQAAWPAGGAAEAAAHGRQAAAEAMATHAYAEAASAYDDALTALSRCPDAQGADRCELMLGLADARSRAGHGSEARRTAERAVQVADAVGDPRLLARAALLVAEHLPFNAVDDEAIALLLRAADGGTGVDDALRARVLARAATATGPGARDEAAERARQAEIAAGDDPAALAVALSAGLHVEWGRHEPAAALAVARRIADLAPDPVTEVEAAVWTLTFAVEQGDLGHADEAVRAIERLAASTRRPQLRHLATSRRAMLTILRGQVEAGAVLALAARDEAARAGLPDADAVLWGQLYAAWRQVGLDPDRAAEMERIARDLTDTSPFRVAHESALIGMLVARDEQVEATSRLEAVVAALDDLPHDLLRVWNLAILADDCVRLRRADLAERVYPLLLPYADRFVVAAGGVACLGSAADPLGRLAALLGRTSEARAHLAAAVAAHRDAGCVRLAQLSAEAEAGLEDDRGDDLAGTVTVDREGSVATVTGRGAVVRLPHSLGIDYLAALVSLPQHDIPATDLAAGRDGAERASAARAPDTLLDQEALASYRRRVAELDQELDEAREWHDTGRVEALENERDFLVAELSGAVGLLGRPRRFTDEAERARVNVTRALRAAIRRIGEQDASLGGFLDAAVTTGYRCRFDPTAVGAGARDQS